jgi:hypothetical protein
MKGLVHYFGAEQQNVIHINQWRTQEFFSGGGDFSRNFFRWGGVQQIQLRTEDRENGDLGAVAP